MEQEEREGYDYREEALWPEWQESWFGVPGDVDDFIFYDSLAGGWEDGSSGR